MTFIVSTGHTTTKQKHNHKSRRRSQDDGGIEERTESQPVSPSSHVSVNCRPATHSLAVPTLEDLENLTQTTLEDT